MKEFLGYSVDEVAVRIRLMHVEALSRYHATMQNTSKNKGFISDGSARAPRFLVHFSDFLWKA